MSVLSKPVYEAGLLNQSVLLWFLLPTSFLLLISLAVYAPYKWIIYATILTSIVLIFLPSIITGKIYGPDSYRRASAVLSVLESGHFELSLYNGMQVFSTIAWFISEPSIISTPAKIGMGILSPLAGHLLLRAIGIKDSVRARTFLILSCYVPLGLGLWLATLSIYHPYNLSLPLWLLCFGLAMRMNSHSELLLFTLLAIGLVMIHPLLFIMLLTVLVFLSLSSITGSNRVISSSRFGIEISSENSIALSIPVIYMIYAHFIKGIGIRTVFIGVGFNTLANRDFESANFYHNVHDPVSPFTPGPQELIGQIFFPLFLFSVLTGTIFILFHSIMNSKSRQKTRSHTLQALTVYGLFCFSLLFIGSNILKVGVLLRILAPVAIVGGVVIVWLSESWAKNEGPVPRTYLHIVVGLSLLAFVLTNALAYSFLPGDYGMIAPIITIIAVPIGISQLYKPKFGTRTAVVILILGLIITPIAMYPGPTINDRPNYYLTSSEEEQIRWVQQHRISGRIAAGEWGERGWQYVDPRHPVEPLVGSQWLFWNLILNDSQEPIAGDIFNKKRVPDSEMEYVMLRPIDQYFTPALYTFEGNKYRTITAVTSERVQQQARGAQRVYDGGESIVFKT